MSANRERGEVSLVIGETSYRLKLSINGMIAAEDESETFGARCTWDQIASRAVNGDLRYLVLFLWALTRKCHDTLTLAQVGDLIDDAGGLPGLLQIIKRAVSTAAPDPEDIRAMGGVASRPRKARRGTGVASTSTPGAVA